MVMYGCFGGLGDGKTMIATQIGFDYYLKGYDVKANYDLKQPYFKTFEKINPMDLLDFELRDCVVLLDEAYTFLDSRVSGSEANRYQSYFLFQSRKRRVKIIYVAQVYSSCDLRLRAITNRWVICRKNLIDPNGDEDDMNNISHFTYEFYNQDSDEPNTLDLPIIEAKKFFNYYNTDEVLTPMYMKPLPKPEDYDKLINTFKTAPSCRSFITISRTDFPYLSYDKAKSIYELLKAGDEANVKKILRIKD